MRFLVVAPWLGLAALTSMAQSCALACTDVGCDSGFTLDVDLPATFEVARTATVTLCRDDRCVTGTFGATTEEPAPGTGRGFPLSPSPSGIPATAIVRATLWNTSSGALTLNFSWSEDLNALANGDRYHLTVTDAQGATLVDTTDVATYQTIQPNGAACGPTCHQASADHRAAHP